VVLLNKIDLVPPSQVSSISTLIRSVNPAVPIFHTVKGSVDLKNIIGIGAYKSGPPEAFSVKTEGRGDDTPEGKHPLSAHHELRGIHSIQVTCPTLTADDFERLDEWIRTVLWENRLPSSSPNTRSDLQVLRCKGMFTTINGEQFILQGVRNLYEICKVEESLGEGIVVPQKGKLVLIGKGLRDDVRSSLEAVFEAKD
jgi:G3E family GTPase